jgi:hypothetical protein
MARRFVLLIAILALIAVGLSGNAHAQSDIPLCTHGTATFTIAPANWGSLNPPNTLYLDSSWWMYQVAEQAAYVTPGAPYRMIVNQHTGQHIALDISGTMDTVLGGTTLENIDTFFVGTVLVCRVPQYFTPVPSPSPTPITPPDNCERWDVGPGDGEFELTAPSTLSAFGGSVWLTSGPVAGPLQAGVLYPPGLYGVDADLDPGSGGIQMVVCPEVPATPTPPTSGCGSNGWVAVYNGPYNILIKPPETLFESEFFSPVPFRSARWSFGTVPGVTNFFRHYLIAGVNDEPYTNFSNGVSHDRWGYFFPVSGLMPTSTALGFRYHVNNVGAQLPTGPINLCVEVWPDQPLVPSGGFADCGTGEYLTLYNGGYRVGGVSNGVEPSWWTLPLAASSVRWRTRVSGVTNFYRHYVISGVSTLADGPGPGSGIQTKVSSSSYLAGSQVGFSYHVHQTGSEQVPTDPADLCIEYIPQTAATQTPTASATPTSSAATLTPYPTRTASPTRTATATATRTITPTPIGSAPALSCAIRDSINVPVYPHAVPVDLIAGEEIGVTGEIYALVDAGLEPIESGVYLWFATGRYHLTSLDAPQTFWRCRQSVTPTPTTTRTGTPGPTWTPGTVASICIEPATPPPAQTGQLPDLILIIPTLDPLPSLTPSPTGSITSSLIISPVQTMLAGVSRPVQTVAAWSDGVFGPSGYALAVEQTEPIVETVSLSFGWLAILADIGPLAWLLPPLVITVLVYAAKPIISLVRYIKQLIPFN